MARKLMPKMDGQDKQMANWVAKRSMVSKGLSFAFTVMLGTVCLHWPAVSDGAISRRLLTAQAIQQRAFAAISPASETLIRTHAGTPAWWRSLVRAEALWAQYLVALRGVGLSEQQLRALTVGKTGVLRTFNDALRVGFTLRLTPAVMTGPIPLQLPANPSGFQKDRRLVFSGRSGAGGRVVFVDADRCEGDERVQIYHMRPSPGVGARAELVLQTGVQVKGADRTGVPGRAWQRFRRQDRRDRFGSQPFIEQSTDLVRVREQRVSWLGPGRRVTIKVGSPPRRKTLQWSKRECCAWVVVSVQVDVNSGRVFAALTERCRWNAIEGDPCFDPAQRQETFANQHCRLTDLRWVRFGRVMEAGALFDRPPQTIALHPKWTRPTIPKLTLR